MPPPPGSDAGPAPPPAPRKVPRGFLRRKLFSANPLGIVGLVFTLVGLPFVIVFPIIGIIEREWLFLIIGGSLGLVFAGLGIFFVIIAIRNAQRKIQAHRLGDATTGVLVDVYRDQSVTVNSRNPWTLEYEFNVVGAVYSGKATSWSRAAREREPGQPLHVLYLRDKPDDNTIYPAVQ